MNRYRISWERLNSTIQEGKWKHHWKPIEVRFQIHLIAPMKYECSFISSEKQIRLGKRVTVSLAERLCEEYIDEQIIIADEEERIVNKGW